MCRADLNVYCFIVTFLLSIVSYEAFAQCNVGGTCTLVANGATTDITQHSVCRRVTNSTGSTIMVPHNTSAEWSSFYSNPPTNVTAPACPTCAGYSYGGYCYYQAGLDDCNSICSSRGGVNAAGMAYITTHASGQANCAAVANAISGFSWPDTSDATSVGCRLPFKSATWHRSSLGYDTSLDLDYNTCACNN